MAIATPRSRLDGSRRCEQQQQLALRKRPFPTSCSHPSTKFWHMELDPRCSSVFLEWHTDESRPRLMLFRLAAVFKPYCVSKCTRTRKGLCCHQISQESAHDRGIVVRQQAGRCLGKSEIHQSISKVTIAIALTTTKQRHLATGHRIHCA